MADEDDGEWVGVLEAARRLGVTPSAVRGRIQRKTIAWKPNGNVGRLVCVPRACPGTSPEPAPSMDPERSPSMDPSAALIGELRDRIAELQAERVSLRQEMARERAIMQETVAAQLKVLSDVTEELRRDRRRSWWPWRRSA